MMVFSTKILIKVYIMRVSLNLLIGYAVNQNLIVNWYKMIMIECFHTISVKTNKGNLIL
jgi:hypothetical protein